MTRLAARLERDLMARLPASPEALNRWRVPLDAPPASRFRARG